MGFLPLRYLAALCLPVLASTLTGCRHSPEANDPQAAASAFFATVAGGDTKTAYDNAAFSFQASQTPEAFRSDCQELGLIGAQAPVWTKTESQGKDFVLAGVITIRSHTALDLSATMVRDQGAWKLAALHTGGPQPGAADRFTLVGKGSDFKDVYHQPVPDPQQLSALAQETMARFAEAVRARNFDGFYHYVAQGWRDGTIAPPNAGPTPETRGDTIAPDGRITPQLLENHFGPFIEKKVDLTEMAKTEPVFDEPPRIDSDGFLTMSGYFQDSQLRANFRFQYTYELPNWRLSAIDLGVMRQ